MKALSCLATLLLVGCAANPGSTKPKEYTDKANTTYLAEKVDRGPQSPGEQSTCEKIDTLFAESPGYESYKTTIGKPVQRPKILFAKFPKYPKWAVGTGLEAEVSLAVRIDKNGNTMEVKTLRATDARFVETASEAVRKWKFSPGTIQGAPARFVLVIPLKFKAGARAESSVWP